MCTFLDETEKNTTMNYLHHQRISGIHAYARKPQRRRDEMNLQVTTPQKHVNNTHTNMTKADRIKIVVPLQPDADIQQLIIQKELMSHSPSKGVWRYRHDDINLTITLQEKTSIIPQTGLMLHKSVAFEFTSKILGERMHELITFDNIWDCLYFIQRMNIVQFDVDEVLEKGDVVLLHITQDKPISTEFAKHINAFTSWNMRNHQKYTLERYYGGFTLDKHGKRNDKRTHQRMTFYNKELELGSSSPSYFHGIYRVERELDSKEKIREALHLGKGQITVNDVFRSNSNAFLDFYSECVNLDGIPMPLTGGTEDKVRMKLVECGFDPKHPEKCDDSKVLTKVEGWLRHRRNPRTGKRMVYASRLLRPYQQYLQRLRLKDAPTITREDITQFFDTSECPP